MSAPSPAAFSFEPFFLALAVVAALAYARAASWARPRRLRIASFAAGLSLVALALNSPLETISDHYLLLIHLLQNAMIADWAPPLLILGLTPAMRVALARRGGRVFHAITQPPVAIALWLLGWYGTHFPPFYDWALRDQWPLNLEHSILIAAGFLFWWPLFEPPPRRLSTGGAIAYLGVAFISSPWLSLAFIFTTRPIYSFYAHGPRLWGLSATKDQNLGGILMNAELTAIFFFAFAFHLLRLLAEEEQQQREQDAAAASALARPLASGGRAAGRAAGAPSESP